MWDQAGTHSRLPALSWSTLPPRLIREPVADLASRYLELVVMHIGAQAQVDACMGPGPPLPRRWRSNYPG